MPNEIFKEKEKPQLPETLINVVSTREGVLQDNFIFTDVESAERKFKDLAEAYLSTWKDEDEDDHQAALDNGYVERDDIEGGYICINWPTQE